MKNRRISYLLSFFFAILLISCKMEPKSITHNQSKTNIVLINIDDLGWHDVGFSGSEFFETPNIDLLSQKGMVFTNGYAAAANCAPSRASLFTGQWLQRHKIFTVASSERGKSEDRKIIPIKNTTTLSDDFLLLPEILKNNGYTTCHSGKWHLTDDPLKSGFDVNIGGSHAGHPTSYYPPYKNVALVAEKGKRLTDLIMDKTIDFVMNTKKPFFVNYAPYAVHTPIQPVPELVDKYKNKPASQGQHNAKYATMVENMDYNVGRLIKALKEKAQLKHTLLIFTSDNGGFFKVSNQQPLRAGKGSYYEGGIRVPFFFVWADQISGNQTQNTPISNLDLLPTILEAAQIQKPKNLQVDGESLIAVLKGEGTLKERPLFWHFPIYLEAASKLNKNRDPLFRTRPGSVVRYKNWKLHHYFEDNELELFNLDVDQGETTNLATQEPEKTKELFDLLNTWRQQTNAPIPTQLNPDYKE